MKYLGIPDGVIHIQALVRMLWFPDTEVVRLAAYMSLTHLIKSSLEVTLELTSSRFIIRNQFSDFLGVTLTLDQPEFLPRFFVQCIITRNRHIQYE